MMRMFRQLGYEGQRHTGQQGFTGNGVGRVGDYLLFHRGNNRTPDHFLTTAAGWAWVRRMLRPAVIAPPFTPGARARLLGGYDGLQVFVDWCPCMRYRDQGLIRRLDLDLPEGLVDRDLLRWRIQMRASSCQVPLVRRVSGTS